MTVQSTESSTAPAPVAITHFSDVLCVWAYVSQIRINELEAEFGEQIDVQYHLCTVFGDTSEKIGKGWAERGGYAGYGKHVANLGKKFDHVEIHPEIWTRNVPASSLSVHHFLHAVAIVLQESDRQNFAKRFEAAIWRVRTAFFAELVDVGARSQQLALAESLGLSVAAIEKAFDCGRAFARLHADLEKGAGLHVNVSPTLVFNEGRQRLVGNVGFRIIEANVRELLRHPDVALSWC